MADDELSSDCERCCGLCCLAHSFERSESFAFDKPALEPCPSLRHDARCDMHAELAARGMIGCARYECAGAGPRVVHEIFGGLTWRDQPELMVAMASAFLAMRDVQELRALLSSAARLPLDAERRARRTELARALEPSGGWSVEKLEAFAESHLSDEVARFLRSLEALVSRPRRLPVVREPTHSRLGAAWER